MARGRERSHMGIVVAALVFLLSQVAVSTEHESYIHQRPHTVSLTPTTPTITITSPLFGYIHDEKTLVVKYKVEPPPPPSPHSYVQVRVPKQSPLLLYPGAEVILQNLEPGTHVIEISLHTNSTNEVAKDFLMFDAIFPVGELKNHQLWVGGKGDGWMSPLVKKVEELRTYRRREPGRKIKVCFVTSLKMDGQRVIFLQQLRHLSRDVYDMVVLNLSGPESGSETFARKVRELGIPLIFGKTSSMRISDLEQYIKPEDMNEVNIVRFLLNCFDRSGGEIEKIQPSFVRESWEILIQEIKGVSADIMVFANGRELNDLWLARAARVAGIKKIVYELPNLFPPSPIDVDVVVSPSHYAAQHDTVLALKKEHIHGSSSSSGGTSQTKGIKSVVITPGVNVSDFKPLWMEEDGEGTPSANKEKERGDDRPVLIGFVARLEAEKSPGLFLYMAKLVHAKHPSSRFIIVGEGTLRPSLEAAVEKLGIPPGVVEFRGGVYQDLPQLMQKLDILVNPSLRAWSETFCIVNVEAMAVGLPIVTFAVGGEGEYFQDTGVAQESNSVVVTEPTPEALAAGVLSLIQDSQKREILGLRARATVLRHFTVERQMERYDRLYHRLYFDEI